MWNFDVTDEFKRRADLLRKINGNAANIAIVMAHYRHDPVAWINDWCVTVNPKAPSGQPRFLPFVLFDKQKEFIQFLESCLRDKEGGLIEKSRDIGASWCCVAYGVWLWLFVPGTSIGFGSKTRDKVDIFGNMDSLFEKIRTVVRHLPLWMMPAGFDPRRHATFMKLVNPENGSDIKGGIGDDIGRGGRSTIYFKDESAHYEHPELIEAALSHNTDVQIDISSVNGTANPFYRRRAAGVEWTPESTPPKGFTRVFIFDWRDDPRKNQEWYDDGRAHHEREGNAHIWAQEVDRDYSGAVLGVIIPQLWVKAAIDAHIKLGWQPEGSKRAMQDVADGGGDKNGLVIMHGNVYVYADHWSGEAGEAAKLAVPICNERGVSELYWDSVGVGTGFKVQINTMKESASWNRNLRVFPWNGGGKPLDPDSPSIPGDYQSPLNKDQYKNLKAQSWFRTRSKFYKTYMAVTKGEKYPHSELISISSDIKYLHEFCLELSQPVRKMNEEGKTIVDKKPDGASSPNLADAAIGADNPCAGISILDVL